VARILIVGGGCRGRRLASAIAQEGHAVRITTRSETSRAAIERAGAECWIGTPDRLATLRAALEGVTILCWLLGSAVGGAQEVAALHGSRLEFFLTQAIDTTVRGVIYEASGTAMPPQLLREGAAIARAVTQRNAIPLALLSTGPEDVEAWLMEAGAAVQGLLSGA
jgi:nucleoside-diphosphate-sugar epimerase